MAGSETTEVALGLPFKEEEGAYESAEKDQPSEEEFEKWVKLLSKSKKYHILKLEGKGEGVIPKHTLPGHLRRRQDRVSLWR